VIILIAMAYQLLTLKRFYEQNGGPILKGVKNIRIYTKRQLKHITKSYKDAIGEGHFGKVYLGTLKDEQKVAIKKTIKVDDERRKEFIEEVIIQSGMRHKNIVRLLGCCLQMDVPMLVYEFVANGSLYDVLFKQGEKISVDTRLMIAAGAAEGLSYMHSAVENGIRHGDVKSANILLDETFTPKVSDFGTSRLLPRGKAEATDMVIGDMGYIAPEYMAQGIVTQKNDVYSFGIVLIELITRRAATYDDNRSYVVNFVQACLENRTRNFIDNDITREEDIKLLEMVCGVAVECLKPKHEERPDMKQVERQIQEIIGQSAQQG
jgi:serine/threonine protein kinase